MTDAAAVLGYLDPEYFLGGRLGLDLAAAHQAIESAVAEPLGLSIEKAAQAIVTVASESMVLAIREITVNQGIDPRDSLLVAGGGAGGLNAVMIGRALGCSRLLVPGTAGALSACGAQFADLVAEFSISKVMETTQFDFTAANAVLAQLEERMSEFQSGLQLRSELISGLRHDFLLEARYPFQVWELEVELPGQTLGGAEDLARVVERFHEVHERTFAVKQPDQPLECQHWKARVVAELAKPTLATNGTSDGRPIEERTRSVYFGGPRAVSTPCYLAGSLDPGFVAEGPAIFEEATTTIVVPRDARVTVTPLGNYLIETEEGV